MVKKITLSHGVRDEYRTVSVGAVDWVPIAIDPKGNA